MNPYYQDEWVQIYNANAFDVLPTFASSSIALIITDPPYASLDVAVSVGTTTRLVGLDQLNGKRLASSNGKRWFSTLSAEEMSPIWWQCRQLLSSNGALYVFSDVKSGLEVFPMLNPANVLIWDKGHIGMGYNWRRMHEWIAFCPMKEHKLRDLGAGDILRYPGVQNKEHPTEKPVSLLKALIQNSTDPGDLILDPFMGSGTTLRAAKDLGRKAIGIEINEAYCAIAATRMAQLVMRMEGI